MTIILICTSECLPHIPVFLLAVTEEVSKVAGVDVRADGDEEMLIELKGTWELLWQLPHALQELIDDRRLLFRIAVQVSIPTPPFKGQVKVLGKFRLWLGLLHEYNQNLEKKKKTKGVTLANTSVGVLMLT